MIFNVDKFQFQETVEFAGFEINQTGYKPLQKIIEAIQNFLTPKNITDIRSWFGLVNQLAYAFAQATVMAPFRDLLTKNEFYWDSTLSELFHNQRKRLYN